LLKLLRESQATVMQATPATWRLLLDVLEEPLRLKVLCGGEALPGSLVAELREALDGPIYNLYGPTETTIWSALHEVNEADAGTAIVSIGKPIANTQLYLLDEAMQPVPVGVRGELYIGGDGVARGYWNRSDLTAERFVPDPFHKRGGQRLYRTGDEARYLENGEIEYLGRSDQQVKLRGFRIELGEIEAALREHESVSSAAVAVRGERLVAYVVGETIDGNVLREHLQQRLPDYMVPSYYMTLAALPQTPNGKLDRKALPEPEPSATGAEYEAPRTPVEEVLSAIVAEVLQLPQIGRNDDFFTLGGHSLLASQLLFRLQKAFQVELSLLSIFQTPRVADLAAHISRLQTSEALTDFPTITPDPEQRHQPFPLTDVQQAYWIGRTGIFELGNVATHIAVEIESTGLDIERLNHALQRLITRHEMLRAIVLPDGRQQILDSVPPYQIEILDLRKSSPETKAAKLEEVRVNMSHQVLRADQWPLFEIRASRLDDQTTRIHLSFDLLIGDARSFQIISQELRDLYNNPDQETDTFELSFRDYVLAEAQLQHSPLYQRSQQYWLDRLATLPPAPDLPLAKIPNTITKPRFVRRYGELPNELWQQLKQRAARAGVTPSGLLLAAFAEVLSVWSKSPKFTINLTLFNRLPLHEQVNDIVGDFTSLTLLAVDNSEVNDFETRARRIQAQLWSDMDHRYMSGVQVLREVARAQGGKAGATMPVVFTSMLSLQSPERNEGWSLNWLGKQVYGISQTPQVWLDHQAFEDDGKLGFNWDAVEELFPDELLDDMFDAYLRLLHSLAESDEWQITTRELIPAHQLLQRAQINATEAPITDELLHTLFAAQVDRRSKEPAVIHNDRTLTYQELFAESNQLAHRLRRLGARPNKLIAVVMEKGWEQTVAVLGILKSGAAYLPIEATLPAERISYLLEQGEAEIVVTQSWIDEKLSWPNNVHRVTIGSEELATESVEPLSSLQRPDDLAYVIFTSGSTGQPKGVMIDHRGAVNTVLDINQRFEVGANDRVLALSSLSFDLSVWDIFGILAVGGAIVVPTAASRRDPQHWAELVARHGVTIWNSVPALINIQVDHVGERGRESLESLRLVMMSGDWIPVSLPDRIKSLVEGIEVFSLGGATEASIWSIIYPIAEVDPSWKSIPYGQPMLNQSFHVLNERLEPCPVWTVGELYIGGIGLAKGYWRDEQKTNRSFITHPRTGERLYRTGDLGRYLPDGNIEFLGREDSQVKIQGYRIELGEIEAALEEHEDVRTAVVNAFGEQRGSKRLIGYIIPEQKQPTSSELQQHLKAKLPEYMIPTAFMFLDKLPLSSNGKVDRRALPEPERIQHDELVAAGNWKEEALVSIWSKVLGLEQVGINDNFFELGGDSILSIRAAAQASEAGLRLTPDQIFQYRTIAELSSVIGTTDIVKAEQGTITGNVPLTPIQHWFFEQDFINPHHWNQALLLEVRQALDPAPLRRAVQQLLVHHDALRLRFIRDDSGWRQENADIEAESPFHWVDLSELNESQQTAAIEAIAAETQASLDLSHGPLLRLVTFNLGAGKPGRLLIVIHHLVIDGVSWRILLDDLERAYDALKHGETASLPPKTTSYKQWSEKLSGEAQSGAFDDEIEYWANVLQQPVVTWPLDYDEREGNTAQSAQLLTKSLSEHETRALLYEIAEAYHTQINEVLLTALAEGFRRWTGERSVVIDVEGHGREAIVSSVDLARTVGWFTAIYPVQLVLPNVWEPGAALKEVKEQFRAVPRSGVGYGILKYLKRSDELLASAAPVSFNYLGQLDQVISGSSLYQMAPESVGSPYSPKGKRTHLLAFYGSVFGGQFQLGIEYSRNLHRKATIEKLAEDFMTSLREIITHCTSGETFAYTPSDFPLINVDQEQLDKAFSVIEFEE
jgi:amino acid adenylation domain-containing protein/non-ribosomal peptide synthase protein (TIGR01720 family)